MFILSFFYKDMNYKITDYTQTTSIIE